MKNIYQMLKYSKLNRRKYIPCCEGKEKGTVLHNRASTLWQNTVEFKELIVWLWKALR